VPAFLGQGWSDGRNVRVGRIKVAAMWQQNRFLSPDSNLKHVKITFEGAETDAPDEEHGTTERAQF